MLGENGEHGSRARIQSVARYHQVYGAARRHGDEAVHGPLRQLAVRRRLEQVARGDGGGEASGAGDAGYTESHLQQPLRTGVELVASADRGAEGSGGSNAAVSEPHLECAEPERLE